MEDRFKIELDDIEPLDWSCTLASACGAGVNMQLMIAGVGLVAEYQVYSSGARIYAGSSLQAAIDAYNDPR